MSGRAARQSGSQSAKRKAEIEEAAAALQAALGEQADDVIDEREAHEAERSETGGEGEADMAEQSETDGEGEVGEAEQSEMSGHDREHSEGGHAPSRDEVRFCLRTP